MTKIPRQNDGEWCPECGDHKVVCVDNIDDGARGYQALFECHTCLYQWTIHYENKAWIARKQAERRAAWKRFVRQVTSRKG